MIVAAKCVMQALTLLGLALVACDTGSKGTAEGSAKALGSPPPPPTATSSAPTTAASSTGEATSSSTAVPGRVVTHNAILFFPSPMAVRDTG